MRNMDGTYFKNLPKTCSSQKTVLSKITYSSKNGKKKDLFMFGIFNRTKNVTYLTMKLNFKLERLIILYILDNSQKRLEKLKA